MIMMIWMLLIIVYSLYGYEGINSQSVRVVSVCPGEQLLLTCISNQSITLRWAITLPERNITRSRLVPNTGSRVLTPIRETLNHNVTVIFMFTRTSEDGMLPLISHLAIGKTTNHLNGTEIHCSSSNTHVTFLVHIQGTLANSLSHLKVNKTESFGTSDITVCLELEDPGIDGVAHNITIFPQVDVLNTTNTSVCFTAPYNIVHNVSIISSICGMYTVSAEFEVYYGKPCNHPLSSGEASSINVTVMGITDPITEGTTAIFSCPLGQILTGPNVSVCMGNGEWVPDTEELEVQCVKRNQILTSQTSINMYIFIGVGSSAALVVLMSLTVLICACACCYFKKKTIIIANESGDKPTAPIYEDVPPKRKNCQETDIDFETNVAYSTVKTVS